MSKQRWLKLATALVGVSLATSTMALTLEYSVKRAVDTYPEVLIAAKGRLAVNQALRRAKADYYPTVDLHAGIGKEWSKNSTVKTDGHRHLRRLVRKESGIFVNQNLFRGWATVNEVERNRARLDSASHQLNADAEDAALHTIETYLEILHRQERVEFARENYYSHKKTYNMIKRRDEQGLSRKADVEQALGRLTLARANLQAERANLRDAQITFMRIVGEYPEKLKVPNYVSQKALPWSLQRAVDMAIAHHPRLKQAQADLNATISQNDVSRAPFYPEVNLELGASRNRHLDGSYGSNHDYFVMLRANWNIYRGGADVATFRETAFLVEQAREVMHRTYRDVKESARFAWNTYKTENQRKLQLERHRVAAGRTVGAYTTQFKLGKRTLLDLLDSENEYFSAKLAYSDSEYSELTARYRILNSTGQLLKVMHIAAPAEQQTF